LFLIKGSISSGKWFNLKNLPSPTRFINSLPVFCGGILAGILGFDLVRELMSNYRPVGIMAGVSLGIFLLLLMDRFLHNSIHTLR
jgi:hypothetical protein